jgi:hypothetical protein
MSYSFGDGVKEICKYANVDSKDCENGFRDLAPVAAVEILSNAWGLHEMHGNVREWVLDWHDSVFYLSSNVDPANSKAAEYRVVRGGSFNLGPVFARSAARLWNLPEVQDRNIGFRCARGAVPGDGALPRVSATLTASSEYKLWEIKIGTTVHVLDWPDPTATLRIRPGTHSVQIRQDPGDQWNPIGSVRIPRNGPVRLILEGQKLHVELAEDQDETG